MRTARRVVFAAMILGVTAGCGQKSSPTTTLPTKTDTAPPPSGKSPEKEDLGHTQAVASLTFSPDGKTLASSSGHSIRLWDVATGRNTATLKEDSLVDAVRLPYLWYSVAFSPDGKTLATGGQFNKVKLWDVGTFKGTFLLDGKMQCPGTVVVFSPDGKTLASGGVCRGEMTLFDVASGKSKATIVTHPEGVSAMAFTPDGKTLASVGRRDFFRGPEEIKLWDVATGKNTSTREAGDKLFCTAAFSSDGKTLATTSDEDKGITLWEVATGKAQFTLKGHTVAFSPDGKTLASGCEDGTITLWDVTEGTELATLKGHAGAIHSLAFSPDGKLLASGSADKTIKLWDTAKTK